MEQALWLCCTRFSCLTYSAGFAEQFDIFCKRRPPEPTGDIIPCFAGCFMTDDAVSLINRDLGYPPPFRKSSRDGDDCVSDGVFRVNYAIFYCESQVLLRV